MSRAQLLKLAGERVTYTPWGGEPFECSAANVEWWEWNRGITESFWGQPWAENDPGMTGLCILEQRTMRSHSERRCYDCGDPGDVEYPSCLIKSVRSYWLCTECDDAQKAKYV